MADTWQLVQGWLKDTDPSFSPPVRLGLWSSSAITPTIQTSRQQSSTPIQGPRDPNSLPRVPCLPLLLLPALLWPLAHSPSPGSTHVGGYLLLPYPRPFATSRPLCSLSLPLLPPLFSGMALSHHSASTELHLFQEALLDHPGGRRICICRLPPKWF